MSEQYIYMVSNFVRDSKYGFIGDFAVGKAFATLELAQAYAQKCAGQDHKALGHYHLDCTWYQHEDHEEALVLSCTYDTGWVSLQPIKGGMKLQLQTGSEITVSAWESEGIPQRETANWGVVITVKIEDAE